MTENRVQVKAFQCKFEGCGKSFSKSSNLTQHLRIHTGEMPYECTICGRKFRQSGNLSKHIKSHENAHLRWNRSTTEKPYKCSYPGCDKSFTAKSSLQNHMRIHTGDVAFTCQHTDCKQTFQQRSTYLAHLKYHHSGESENSEEDQQKVVNGIKEDIKNDFTSFLVDLGLEEEELLKRIGIDFGSNDRAHVAQKQQSLTQDSKTPATAVEIVAKSHSKTSSISSESSGKNFPSNIFDIDDACGFLNEYDETDAFINTLEKSNMPITRQVSSTSQSSSSKDISIADYQPENNMTQNNANGNNDGNVYGFNQNKSNSFVPNIIKSGSNNNQQQMMLSNSINIMNNPNFNPSIYFGGGTMNQNQFNGAFASNSYFPRNAMMIPAYFVMPPPYGYNSVVDPSNTTQSSSSASNTTNHNNTGSTTLTNSDLMMNPNNLMMNAHNLMNSRQENAENFQFKVKRSKTDK